MKHFMRLLTLFVTLLLYSSLSFANTALVIIDMQPYFAERYGYDKEPKNKKKIEQVLQRQRELIQLAKASNRPIVLIEYQNHAGTHDQLVQEIGAYPNTKTFIKSDDGMFESRKLANEIKGYLDSKKITDLVVAGANGGACVQCSIQGALEKGYSVWADPHAIADFNYRDFILPYHYKEGNISVEAKKSLAASFQEVEDIEVLRRQMQATGPGAQEAVGTAVSPETGCSTAESVGRFSLFRKLFRGWKVLRPST